jgi:hypothetical protein
VKKTLKRLLKNMSCFSFYLFSFSFYKIGEQEDGTSPAQGGRVSTSGRGEVIGKGCRRVNTTQEICTYKCKCKNDTC